MPDAPTTDQPGAAVERRIVSVLFADLVGFTPLAERLDSEDVATIQDAYFAAVRATVERYGGVLEKFIGDAAMAVFGVPAARDDDAERAVRAGLALVGAVEQLGAQLGLEPSELQLRVGVNSGEVVHAVTGPDAGRVTGDTVNTAARLQAAADPGTVLIGELTSLAVAESIEVEPMGSIDLKGKAEPVRCWTAIGARPEPSREEALGALRAPMQGRREELHRLATVVAHAGDHASADRIVILAPPGVGKSRLLSEIATKIDATAAVLRARVRPQATAPYETVAQLIRSTGRAADLTVALDAAGVRAQRAEVVEAEVNALLVGTPHPVSSGGGDLAAERDRRFDAWLTALDALAPRTEAWLVEDVHWAGGDLLAFLDRAGRATTRHGRVVVATARPSLLEAAPAWCSGDRIELASLPPADATGMVRALVDEALPDRLIAAIVERSDGTPLFIEELLRTWASVGILAREGDAWRLAVEPDAVSLPPTVQAIYAAQLDDLPPDARVVARRGSVAGRRVPTGALGALGIAGTEGLERLHRRALVDGPVEDELTGSAYAYRHALLRDAGYASLARAERSRLHVAMATWLLGVAGERVDVVAEAIAEHHAEALASLPALAGGDLPPRDRLAQEAAGWYERAAEAALGLAAHEAAVRLFRRSIEHTSDDDPRGLSRRRRRLGEVLAATADLAAGIDEMEAALAHAGEDAANLAASAYALGRAYMQQIRFPEAQQVTAEALMRLRDEPGRHRARLHALHAWAVSAQGRSDGVLEEADAAWDLVQGEDDPLLELEVLEHVTSARDEVDASNIEAWAELETRARALGRWQQVVVAGRILAMHRALEDPETALARLAEVAELARARGLAEQGGWCEYTRCELLWVIGRWDEALAVGDGVLDVAEPNAYERLAFRTWVVLLPMAAEQRLSDLADRYRAWWTTARVHFPVNLSPYGQLLTGAIDAWTDAAHGRAPSEPPAELVEAVIPIMNPHFLAGIETVVGAWLAHGRGDLAALGADRVAEVEDPTPLMRASRALIDAWTGRTDAGAAVAAARELTAPWWLSRALRAAGQDAEAAAIERTLGIREAGSGR